jgi:hypothetical protein
VGRVSATLRTPRQRGEFRAGPLLPLLDQAIAGMSNSTWDVTIADRADTDLALFRQNFKAVESASVINAPLPAFDRVAVQKWWDNSDPKNKDEPAEAVTPVAATATH